MRLLLVRHAVAKQRDPHAWPDDAERPLTARGIRRFRAAARGVRRLAPDVGMVMSSPFTRAWQTAEILRAEAGWAAPRRLDLLSADRPASAVLAGIWEVLPALDVGAAGEPGTRDRSASRASLALVGHEPQLGELAALLLGSGERAAVVFKKGAIACFDVPAGEAVAEGASTGLAATGQLLWLAPPKLLRALAR